MTVSIIAEAIAGLAMIIAGYYYFRSARIFCDRFRSQIQQRNPRWRAILYPAWFWGTDRCVVQLQLSGAAMMLFGILLLVLSVLNILYSHQ